VLERVGLARAWRYTAAWHADSSTTACSGHPRESAPPAARSGHPPSPAAMMMMMMMMMLMM
jgi:hypothetical protein